MTLDNIVRKWVTEKTVVIKASLVKRGKKWAVELDEDLSEDSYQSSYTNPNELDHAVSWVIEKTKNWEGCTRMAYDQWFFESKRDAEKFITLYNLVWA